MGTSNVYTLCGDWLEVYEGMVAGRRVFWICVRLMSSCTLGFMVSEVVGEEMALGGRRGVLSG
jgi:hypothetical protein